jgi:glycosyltransferase involved in cell wall biosynthesis
MSEPKPWSSAARFSGSGYEAEAFAGGRPSRRTLPVSVIVPTIGRIGLLRACLESLARCEPRATEILVVDGSQSGGIAELVENFAAGGARLLIDERKGTGAAVNKALEGASNDIVLLTHDDCVVATDWVAVGARLMAARPDRIVTGRVLALGDPRNVPGLATSGRAREYRRSPARVLLAHNMGCSRRAVLDLGGFDERMLPVSEDDDLAFRWIRSGRVVRYSPELTVWHAAWRTPSEMRKVYRAYAVGDGMAYAKHLLAGDWMMALYIIGDLLNAIRAELVAAVRGERRWWDHRLGTLRGLPVGLWRGFRTFGLAVGRRR